MSTLRSTAMCLLALFCALVLKCSEALARVPLEVAIGSYQSPGNFNTNGYGVLVRYNEQCVVVTLAHVASGDSDSLDIAEVTARTNNLAGSIIYIDGDPERDIYLGLVDPNSPLFRLCEQAEDISLLHEQFTARLGNMLDSDFKALELHSTPSSINITPASSRALNDAKRRRPIRYQLSKCDGGQVSNCSGPVKRFSGSMVSVAIGQGERLWLGLHQGRCGHACQGNAETWQAVSVMQIYEFMASPNSPLNSHDSLVETPSSSESDPDGVRYDTPFPGENDQSFQFREASFEWDIAFSKLLSGLKVMRFPQEKDNMCVKKCAGWQMGRFYGNEGNPNAPTEFRSRYEDLGESGTTLLGATMMFKVPFNKTAFLDFIATGKRLNEVFDGTQEMPEDISTCGRIGFAVHGSPEAWIKFYEQVPVEYAEYLKAVHILFDRYCTEFKPAAEIETANVGEVFFGNLAMYENPCLKKIAWDKMVEGDPSYIIERLRLGF